MFRAFFKYFIFLVFFVPLISLSQTYNIKRFSVEDGLAQSQVVSLFQDKLGNLWIGTNGGGVSIYNGKEFKTLTKDDGLANNVVYSITEDDNGNKYFGTNEGLSIYNGWSFKNFTKVDGLPNDRIWKVVNDKVGNIWLATGKGIAKFANNKISIFKGDSVFNNSSFYTIYFGNKDSIWFGTFKNGAYLYSNHKFVHLTTADSLIGNNVSDIVLGKNGLTWICTDKGINLYNKGKMSSTSVHNTIQSVILSKNVNEVIFCSVNGYIFNEKYGLSISNNHFYKNYNKYKFWTMIEDREGSLWIGTFDGSGLIKFPKRTFFNFSQENDSLLNSNVYSILEISQNKILLGLFSKGANVIDFNNKKDVKVNSISKNNFFGLNINAMMLSSDNILWFATGNGITLFDLNDSTYKYITTPELFEKGLNSETIKGKKVSPIAELCSEVIYSLFEDKTKKIWIGTKKGVTTYFNNEYIDFTKYYPELKGKVIFKIFEDSNRNLWFTSNSGVFYFDGKKLTHIGEKEGFTDETVVSIVQDKRGYYWFGTKQGLFRYDENFFIKINKDKSDLINKEKGLSSNNIYSLLLDDNDNLFIGSDKGIDKFNIKLYNTSRKIEITNYGQLEGFMGQECNLNACYKDHKGRLWFGTVGGATVYDPRFDIKNTVKPITQINSLHLAYKEFDWSPYSNGVDSLTKLPKELVLPYNKNHLTFEFVAASLAIPEKVKYQYLLEGLTTEWSPPRTKSEADFPSLPDGDYIFKVKACNNDGVWNEIPTEFRFTIKPPFWKTWWFYTILTILTLILFFLYVKWREAKLKQDKAILEQTVLERTEEVVKQKELVEQKNKDITDSINYARNIQEAVLVNVTEIKKIFHESFILFRPRDIVSGDFYWFSHRGEFAYIAAADCTGHGVPGAFMSMLGMAFLNEIVNNSDYITPNEVLNSLRENVIVSLHQTGKEGESKDGMDLGLSMINLSNNEMQFAGANNPLYFVRKKEYYKSEDFDNHSSKLQILEVDNAVLIEIKPDKMPIGYYIKDNLFANNNIQLKPSDRVYLFSDGYADQFGGPKGKKFKYTQLKDILLQTNNLNMDEQREFLNTTILEWRGEHEQIDDVLIVGVSIA